LPNEQCEYDSNLDKYKTAHQNKKHCCLLFNMSKVNYMNICLVGDAYPPEGIGGIGTYLKNLANALAHEGNKVFVITKTSSEEKVEQVNENLIIYWKHVKYIPLLERFFPGLGWCLQVNKLCNQLIKSKGIDIIEFPNWESPGLIFQIFNKRFPNIVRTHTPFFETLKLDFEQPTFSQRMMCKMEELSCKLSHGLVSSTRAHAKFIAQEYDLLLSDFSIIPLGIEPKLEVKRLDTEFTKTLLYVSRLENRKGTTTLLSVVPKLVSVFPDLKLNIIGKDRPHAPGNLFFRDYFNQEYPEYKENVNFLGFVSDDELDRYYKEADIFVVPSVYESFGLIYIEAMQYALPIVATTGGGIPEVVENEVAGLLAAPDNKNDLEEKLMNLLTDSKLRSKLGKCGQELFEKKFTAEAMAARTLTNYIKVANK